MSEQALDLRTTLRVAWRHKVILGTATLVGLILGALFAVLHPPLLTSKALVVLPPSASRTIGTQVVVADSNPVLTGALHRVDPPVSLPTLRDRVRAGKVSPQIIAISGQGTTAAQAESAANAVARSYLVYVSSASNPIVRVPAQLLQPATGASGTSLPVRLVIDGLVGVLAGLLIGAIAALVVGRGDRRLRERDEIADAIGVPVLASVSVARPADAAGWVRLLEEYEPGPVQAWSLRKALHHLGLSDVRDGSGASLTVLSMSSDRGALALGPQLAAYAASLGIPTTFVLGPQQDMDATATLRTACAAEPAGLSRRLRVGVRDRGGAAPPEGTLMVAAAVVDAQVPQVPGTMPTTVTVLGVSAGVATAEQLARVAVSATSDGRQIAGILVADPDPADHTTGRFPDMAPLRRRARPGRLTGTTSETTW